MKVFQFKDLFYINDYELHNLHIKDNKIYQTYSCDHCGGKGIIPYFQHYAEGVCFKCYGTGKITSSIKTYKTERNANRAIERYMYKQAMQLINDELSKREILDNFKLIYVIDPRTDTKQYKDKLKDNGCVWSGRVWYTHNIDNLKDFKTISFNIEEYVKDNIESISVYNTTKYRLYYLMDKVNELVQPLIDELESKMFNNDFNKYDINNRYVFNITRVLSTKAYEGPYGSIFYYTLLDSENHRLKYKTSKYIKDINGNYKATIKELNEKELILTRLKKCD